MNELTINIRNIKALAPDQAEALLRSVEIEASVCLEFGFDGDGQYRDDHVRWSRFQLETVRWYRDQLKAEK